MNLLMLGHSRQPGSWTIRGEQLGAALGARVTSTPTSEDWSWADLAIIVKRAEPRYGPPARAAHVPIVWDALDCWKQPDENRLDGAGAQRVLDAHLRVIQPRLTIGATQAQAEAAGGVYLPHHSWPGLQPSPIRETIQVVAYQGNAAYLGAWLPRLTAACVRRGWRFVVNPSNLAEADLIVALRDGPWDGWMCRQWKSGVKLVNAIAAGRPVLMQDTAAAREIKPPGPIIEAASDVEDAFNYWAPVTPRQEVEAMCRVIAPRYQLSTVSAHYRQVLEDVLLRSEVA